MVQLSSRASVHGRYRFARAGRRAWVDRGADSSTACAGHRRWRVRDGSRLGDSATRLVPLHQKELRHRPTDFFDGADTSSLRKKGLVRIPGRDEILHFMRAIRGGRVEHIKDQMKTWRVAFPWSVSHEIEFTEHAK